jgi:hypothetical protein
MAQIHPDVLQIHTRIFVMQIHLVHEYTMSTYATRTHLGCCGMCLV